MIIEQHYDEEVLAEFLGEPTGAVTRDKHLAACDLCKRTLNSLRSTARTLTAPAVWDKTSLSTAPRPDTLAFLRGMQKNMRDEDALAAVWIKELLAGSRESWAPRLAEHPEWRTAGMVRRLLKAGDGAINTVPADAVEITLIALSLAKELGDTPAARHLRSLAAYDHGYSLWYTGRLTEALEQFENANLDVSGVPGAEFDSARVDLMRAMTCQILERRDEALAIAASAAEVFRHYADQDRFAAARSAVATTLQAAQRLREAVAIHSEIAENKGVSQNWRVSAVHNMGLCYQELGEFEAAARCLSQAVTGYESLGMLTFRSKSRWALGQLFAQQGKHAQAVALFKDLRSEFEELEMANDVAMVSLDLAESLLALGRVAEINDVCRLALAYFAKSGLAKTEPALRALAYLQEIATAGRITPQGIHSIRAFLLDPVGEPVRLFAEPPQ